MLVIFLLFLTIPVISSADPKCPDGFTHFKRTPTAKNNHTKDWCLGIFQYPDMANKNRARSICIHHHAMMSIPESQHEFDVISNKTSAAKIPNGHAIDGEISPRCTAKYLQHWYNAREVEGECNKKNQFFLFDDVNTDPTFIKSMAPGSPNSSGGSSFNDTEPAMSFMSTCLAMKHTHYEVDVAQNSSTTYIGNLNTIYCHKEVDYIDDIGSVLCGRHPL